jgi:hypothetical protein
MMQAVTAVPLADPLLEAQRIAGPAQEQGVALRFTGGVGVALACPSARRPPLARSYGDLDLVGRSRDHKAIVGLLEQLGYQGDRSFNALNSHRRLLLHDPYNGRDVDVFVDEAELCHTIDLRRRVGEPGPALPTADLLLMKLQVVETTEKDLIDICALLCDHAMGGDGIDLDYLVALTASDWGLWRTLTMVAARVAPFAHGLEGFDQAALVDDRAGQLIAALEAAPKSRGWRLRAKVGERKRWYELPEEKG